jgi:hypothetical protein
LSDGNEQPEDMILPLKSGESYELPCALRKDAGEAEDAWLLKDSSGKTVLLTLCFTL